MSGHKSDCAVHDAPAYSPGKCDCGFDEHLRIAKSYVGEDYDIVPKSHNGDDDYWFQKYEALSKKYGSLSAANEELLEALKKTSGLAQGAFASLEDCYGEDCIAERGELRRAQEIIAKHEGSD